MRPTTTLSTALTLLSLLSAPHLQAADVKPSPNGIELPEGYKDWPVISVSHRVDNNTLRAIIGNEIAVKAAREGQTAPWPTGTILGKLVWKQTEEKYWPAAISPKTFVHAEFMLKDPKKYTNGTGWGWARWLGKEQKPWSDQADAQQACISCHTVVKAPSQDWVFTTPAPLP